MIKWLALSSYYEIESEHDAEIYVFPYRTQFGSYGRIYGWSGRLGMSGANYLQ